MKNTNKQIERDRLCMYVYISEGERADEGTQQRVPQAIENGHWDSFCTRLPVFSTNLGLT